MILPMINDTALVIKHENALKALNTIHGTE